MELRSSFTYDLRRELSNAYFLAKFGLDTAENEPSQVCPTERSPGHPARWPAAPGRADREAARRRRRVPDPKEWID